jgi:hypothetical protein
VAGVRAEFEDDLGTSSRLVTTNADMAIIISPDFDGSYLEDFLSNLTIPGGPSPP